MKPFVSILSLASAVLLLGACSGSKSFSKKAAQLDASGLYAEAADMYLQSVVRNPKNVEGKIGLKKTGQQLLNDKLSTFFKAFSMGSKEEAVNSYLDAKAYADRVQRAGVVLEIPGNYVTDFTEVKGQYLVELYTKGQDLMAAQDFKGAEVVFARIGALEPGYKDAGSLQSVAYLEPLYRSGKTAMDEKQYRKAYGDLAKVVEKDAAYKDARALRDQCVELGRYAIAVLPFSGPDNRKAQAATVQAYATTAITDVNDPFLTVVDRDDIQKILDEQRLGMSGVVDESTAVKAGKLMGAQAVLMGTLIDYREEPGQLRKSTKDGFEAYKVKQLNKETNEYYMVTKYKPVKYVEYYQENKVYLSFSYKLVSLETGQVLMSKVVDKQTNDHAYYAAYDGDRNSLFPMQNGVVNERGRRDLVGLLNATHELKPVATLGTELLRTSCSGMAGAIQQELAAKLP
ncbi:MAG TPA: CsgG/HfaB family protein [Flavobacteriales bacterium]|jgi:tetratricopeptide (TPR) repeat protein|nr:CsgG/HfaB family protein [Flavobacteriales bacterium]